MTTDIDRTIEKLKLVVEKMKVVGDSNYWTMEEHKQIADWLEELKELRKEKDKFDRNVKFFNEINVKSHKEGYNKAIDDFLEKNQWEYLDGCGIKQSEKEFLINVSSQVAEQLKAGEVDDL